MMNLSKKALALAVAAAAVGVGVVSQVQAQAVAQNSLGQALIYPYMTANNGWQTFLHVVNTSDTYTVAAKVRFRTAKDSLDAYDLILVLSPNDMWTAVVEEKDGTYGFRPTDNSCIVPPTDPSTGASSGIFQPFNIQTSEVYAEIITMGLSRSNADNSVAVNAKHNSAGVPADCGAVVTSFASAANVAALNEFNPVKARAAQSLNAGTAAVNVLTGKFDLVNVGNAWSGASRATAISNFGAPVDNLLDGATTGPAFSNTNMWSQSADGWDHPTLAEARNGLDAINTILTKTNLINEWVLNPNLGELSSWIVTFPTKKLTVDAITAQNAITAQKNAGVLHTFGTTVNGMADCVAVTPAVYNREESVLVTGSGGSGSNLCYEANVINFKSGSIDSSSVLDSNVATTFTTTSVGVLAGWMNLAMPTNTILAPFSNGQNGWTTLPGWVPVAPIANAGAVGRPVVGFNVTARATPSDTVLYEHAYLP